MYTNSLGRVLWSYASPNAFPCELIIFMCMSHVLFDMSHMNESHTSINSARIWSSSALIMSRVQRYVSHDSFTCEWLICMWMHHVLFGKSHMNEAYMSIISAHISIRSAHSSISSALLMSRVQRYVWHDAFTCEWLIHMWMNHVSFVMSHMKVSHV